MIKFPLVNWLLPFCYGANFEKSTLSLPLAICKIRIGGSPICFLWGKFMLLCPCISSVSDIIATLCRHWLAWERKKLHTSTEQIILCITLLRRDYAVGALWRAFTWYTIIFLRHILKIPLPLRCQISLQPIQSFFLSNPQLSISAISYLLPMNQYKHIFPFLQGIQPDESFILPTLLSQGHLIL